MVDNRKYLHVDDAVRDYGVGRTKLYELIRAGVLPAHKLGRRTLLRIDELNSCFERETTPIRHAKSHQSA